MSIELTREELDLWQRIVLERARQQTTSSNTITQRYAAKNACVFADEIIKERRLRFAEKKGDGGPYR